MKKQTKKLTDAIIRQIEINTEVILIQDTTNRYLHIRISKLKKTWYYIRKIKYAQYNFKLGEFPQIGVQTARIYADKQNGKVAENPHALEKMNILTLSDALDFWANNRSSKYPFAKYLPHWENLFNKQLSNIGIADIVKVHRFLADTPVTANRSVAFIQAIFSFCEKNEKYNGSNPAKLIKKYPEKPRRRFLNPKIGETQKLIEYLEAAALTRNYADSANALLLMLYTGKRKGNVLAINKKTDIFNQDTWIIEAHKEKTGKENFCKFNSAAMKVFQRQVARHQNSEWLFPAKENSRYPYQQDCKNFWNTVRQKLNLQDCHIHDLRHTLGTVMLNCNVPIAFISEALGHSSIKVTERVYAHATLDNLQKSTQVAVDAMLGLKSSKN